MRNEIRDRISEYAETEYREFSAALIPGAKQLLGVRLPKLREIAKDIAKGDWRSEVKSADGEYADVYFEETMLRGMIIGYGTAKKDVTQSEGIQYLEQFVPMIDDWSVCDSFCNSFSFANKHRDAVWEVLQNYLYSDKEFEVRVALILLLSQYLKYDSGNKKLSRNRNVSMAALEKNSGNMERST
ncbi:MAG: DNA alkylation repair protein, partial [Lachnospiraceae bacterium]|nr:DNA alkylation repair protein [Lachnospiraceae bacterium]